MSTEGIPPTFPGSPPTPPPPRPAVRLLREAAILAANLLAATVLAVALVVAMGAFLPLPSPAP